MATTYESIMNMNETNAKHAKWCVRVLKPQLQPYTFQARGQTVNAKQFTCVLVGDKPSEYMVGCVPFDFKAQDEPDKAFRRFTENTVWKVSKPAFDVRSKAEFNGSPMKLTLLLRPPTLLTAAAVTDTEAYAYPVRHVIPPVTLACIVGLKGTAPGNAPKKSRAVDVVAKVLEISEPRDRVCNGMQTKVRDVMLGDDSQTGGGHNTKCTLSAWGEAGALFADIAPGQGVTLLGCSASLDDRGEIRISFNPRNARLLLSGPRVEQLTAWDCDAEACEAVTIPWQSRGIGPIKVEGPAVFTCAVAMAQLQKGLANPSEHLHGAVFQVNRGLISAPSTSAEVHTQNGKSLFVQAVFRDWSDRVDVYVVESAVPSIYGLETNEEVEERAAAGTLEVVRHRVNVRGVVRVEEGKVKYFVAETCEWDNCACISRTAARLALGFNSIQENVVVASPLAAITRCPMLGLAIKYGDGCLIGAHRVIMLVEGTQPSRAQPLAGGGDPGSFLVESKQVKCMLGTEEAFADIRGYCDFDSMLQYRLDKEKAVVMISHIDRQDMNSNAVLTIDFMCKVSESNVKQFVDNLREEAELLTLQAGQEKPPSSLAAPQESKRARMLQLEPTTPTRR